MSKKSKSTTLEVKPGSPAAAWIQEEETTSPALATTETKEDAKPVESGNSQTVAEASQGGDAIKDETTLAAEREKNWSAGLAKAKAIPASVILNPFGFGAKRR